MVEFRIKEESWIKALKSKVVYSFLQRGSYLDLKYTKINKEVPLSKDKIHCMKVNWPLYFNGEVHCIR